MKIDIRAEAAQYYDSCPDFPNDIPFYRERIPSPDSSILELGCGTGRVTLSLAPDCGYIHGLDLSAAMISVCQAKLLEAHLPPSRVQVMQGDITDFDLERTFDLIIAPYRVLQNLETDQEVDGLFRCLRKHLAPGGTGILTVFRPLYEPEELIKRWETKDENIDWEVPVEGGRLACYVRRTGIDAEKLVLYPELIYRRYVGGTLVGESVLKIVMRCYYPDAFEKLVVQQGFRVLNRWGGYAGETYGQGPELVIQFAERR
jgi:SAM-dependent methyltransferase